MLPFISTVIFIEKSNMTSDTLSKYRKQYTEDKSWKFFSRGNFQRSSWIWAQNSQYFLNLTRGAPFCHFLRLSWGLIRSFWNFSEKQRIVGQLAKMVIWNVKNCGNFVRGPFWGKNEFSAVISTFRVGLSMKHYCALLLKSALLF